VTGAGTIPVCIFSKPPVPGEVKTRLIPALGAVGAARLAVAMLSDVWRTVESCPGVRPILATTRLGDFPVPVSPEDIWLHGGGDLGQRIERIFTRALVDSAAAIAVGADSPALTRVHLEAALEALQTSDAVIGPSMDGGFYLLGLRRCRSGLFSSLQWSSAQTRQGLTTRLEAENFAIAELEPLFDIDTPGDLLLLEQFLAAHPSLAPATRVWCALDHANQHHCSSIE
jgi:rSAM/selenodomain-associated transferase 1